MDIASSIIIGLIHGFGEFLPISLSGHLVFFQAKFGAIDHGLIFDILLRLGTLSAVIFFYKSLIWRLVQSAIHFKKPGWTAEHLMLQWLFWAMIPTIILFLLFQSSIESLFHSARAAGFFLLLTGMVNLWINRLSRNSNKEEPHSSKNSFWIGVGQSLSLFQGFSRMGLATFSGLKAGLTIEKAIQFSFLLSIPAQIGIMIFTLTDILDFSIHLDMLIGMFTAFLSGLIAIHLFFHLIQTKRFYYFAWYCFFVGGLMLL